ncbi:MAG: hypothetical protein OEY20_07025, partial [Gemmatimonadota bacterium]|nr:hypothetical protein [Gemmatimonadota bacterium]
GQVTEGAQWRVVNRVATVLAEDGKPVARLSEALLSGFARLEGVEFDQGVIEFAVRGKNVPQRSFVGVAFHGVDDETYDAVYFRPFNFMSGDSTRRSHGVQYVAHPTFTWQKLRTEHPGEYEQPVDPAPDPDGWFHARVVVEDGTVSVFVNEATAPSLVVGQLSDRAGGWVGLWVGSGSGGDFADLRITRRE